MPSCPSICFPGKKLTQFGLIFCATLAWSSPANCEEAATPKKSNNVLDSIPLKIAKEPKYASIPRSALLVLGTQGESKVWMVEDGKRLYLDKNANGDLTDDGPPIEPANVRDLKLAANPNPSWDFDYIADAITPANGPKHTEFRLRRWNYADNEVSYGLSITLQDALPMYAGWFSTFWAASPEVSVPVIHFGGPLKPQILRFKSLRLAPDLGD